MLMKEDYVSNLRDILHGKEISCLSNYNQTTFELINRTRNYRNEISCFPTLDMPRCTAFEWTTHVGKMILKTSYSLCY